MECSAVVQGLVWWDWFTWQWWWERPTITNNQQRPLLSGEKHWHCLTISFSTWTKCLYWATTISTLPLWLNVKLSQTNQPDYGSQDLDTPVETVANTNLLRRSLLFVFGSLKSVVKPRPGYRRVIVLLGVFNFMCYIFTYNGTEGTHRYYYAQAGKYQ